LFQIDAVDDQWRRSAVCLSVVTATVSVFGFDIFIDAHTEQAGIKTSRQ